MKKILYIFLFFTFPGYSQTQDTTGHSKNVYVEIATGVNSAGWYKKFNDFSFATDVKYELNKFSFLIAQFSYVSLYKAWINNEEVAKLPPRSAIYHDDIGFVFNFFGEEELTENYAETMSSGIGIDLMLGADLLFMLEKHELILAVGGGYKHQIYSELYWEFNDDGSVNYFSDLRGRNGRISYMVQGSYTYYVKDNIGVGIREFKLGNLRYNLGGVALHCAVKL